MQYFDIIFNFGNCFKKVEKVCFESDDLENVRKELLRNITKKAKNRWWVGNNEEKGFSNLINMEKVTNIDIVKSKED